ncbi:MAG: intein-containing RctB family protein [Candidatus Omnitrophica bacterium]|nr:intein-containing RctB family protein [Candidatus Omnitrophota bacterium]MBU4487785.1 intein-containing RctB family protein [Candidatus Omnitrophota bacterium]MCG2705575.1 intein-containing RctB family protein [Candidatus Omnitrophota bacterium]
MANDWQGPLEKISDYKWQIPRSFMSGMRVPGLIYADEKLLKDIRHDKALQQVANAACLPGIVNYSLAMPDIHWGYGLPIGGVVATDIEAGGVITPGGVGYDINCLSGSTKILLENGAYIFIGDSKKIFQKKNLACINFEKKDREEAPVAAFLKIRPKNRVLEMKTLNGNRIVATEDHPFWTPDGMIPIRSLNPDDVVAIYPFEGVQYEEPSDEIIVDENDIKKYLLSIEKDSRGHGLEQVIIQLRKRNLFPLRYNSPQLPYILKMMGYNFGDGNIYFLRKRGKGFTWFYGQKNDLEDIRKDAEKIGFTCSRAYSRKRMHEIETMYSKYSFTAENFSCKVGASAFAALLACLGTPVGSKTAQSYRVPQWIMKAPLWQKRLFLAAFFGAEMSTPKTLTGYGYNFYCPTVSMNKTESIVDNGKDFLKDIEAMLKEFSIVSNAMSCRTEYKCKDNTTSMRLRLQLSNTTENLLNLYSKIGFEYNRKRRRLSNIAVQYLKMKKGVIEKKEFLAEKALTLSSTGLNAKAVYKELGPDFGNLRFIERSIYGKRQGKPRMSPDAITFDEFVKYVSCGMEESGMVWDTIESITKIEFNDYVYDFTVGHKDHNFIADNFVVSNCGLRLVRTNLAEKDVVSRLDKIVNTLFSHVPAGIGSTSDIRVNDAEEKKIMMKGAAWAVAHGYGAKDDLEHTEEKGCMEGADPDKVSERAYERGKKQSGTLGSGNHFLEVQVVDEVYDDEAAIALGVRKGQATVMIHSGSRGFGYQICDDYAKSMVRLLSKYDISVPDRQLACVPVKSDDGQDYIKAMKCAANYAWNNRQCLMHKVRESFEQVFEKGWEALGMSLVWDVAHNIAKFERYNIGGKEKLLCVHRKGATRAFGPGNPELPAVYKDIGQPVIIPGDMGRNSYLLLGTKKAEEETFASTCHGAGRLMSRTEAMRSEGRKTLLQDLAAKGIKVMAVGKGTLAEEAPYAYKNVNEVVDVVHNAGIARKVCRMRPLGVIKG